MPAEQQTWTILDLLKATTTYFESHHITPARLTAEILLAYALKIRRLDLYLRYDQPCTVKEREAFREVVKRRGKGEPTQYIVGQAEFWSMTFKVDPRVLVPRPDTEVLVEEALEFAKTKHPKGEGLRIIDLGTGSGAVALALKKELPEATVYAIEKDAGAFAVAKQNTEALKLSIELLEGDLFSPVEGQRFDIIVSNPPYIATKEIPTLPKEVAEFEPKLALDGGPDGLDIVRRLFERAPSFLNPGGACMVEIAPEQSQATKKIAEDAGFTAKIRKDYEARDRVVVAHLK